MDNLSIHSLKSEADKVSRLSGKKVKHAYYLKMINYFIKIIVYSQPNLSRRSSFGSFLSVSSFASLRSNSVISRIKERTEVAVQDVQKTIGIKKSLLIFFTVTLSFYALLALVIYLARNTGN